VSASFAVLVLAVVAAGSPVAVGVPRPAQLVAKAPVSTRGLFVGVAAVPHSSDVWAIGNNGGGLDNATFFVVRRHHGHWQKVKAPKLGGRYGSLTCAAAGSAKTVWVGGATQVRPVPNQLPGIWRWSGKEFVAQKLPKMGKGEAAISSISASSATNAWAVGVIYPLPAGNLSALHWNGKKWSPVAIPEPLFDVTPISVSTSSATNAWATDGTNLFHWNGKVWTTDGAAPANVVLEAVATDSPHLAYAVGHLTTSTGFRSYIMRFNGKTWSSVPVPKQSGDGIPLYLYSVSLHGKSGWAVGFTGSNRTIIEHTTGGAWKTQHTPKYLSNLVSVSAESANRAYAVGTVFANGGQRTYFQTYNGHTWTAEPSKL
jgi:hypothetical protein